MSTDPFRYARVPAVLGALGVAALFPALASAQTVIRPHEPIFQRLTAADSTNGPIVSVVHGRFNADDRQTVAAVSDAGPDADGADAPAAVALFGDQGGGAYGLMTSIPLYGSFPIASTAGDVDGSGQESVVVVTGYDNAGTLEYFNLHDGPKHGSLGLPGIPVGVAVGKFLPGHDEVIAVSFEGNRIAFYRAGATGIDEIAVLNDVESSPLAVARRLDSNDAGDALLARRDGGEQTVRWQFETTPDGDPDPYRAFVTGAAGASFAVEQNLMAQDPDRYGNRWYASRTGDVTSASWVMAGGSLTIGANGPYLPTARTTGAPVAMDVYGRGDDDSVVTLDGETLRVQDIAGSADSSVPFGGGGRQGAALDVDGDHRDDLAVAEGTAVTLYRNVTTAPKPALEPDALTPSVRDTAGDVQVVAANPSPPTVPTDDGDEYQCALDATDVWRTCAGVPVSPAFEAPDGPHVLHVRRRVVGTPFWSPVQDIAFRVDTAPPAKPTVQGPDGPTHVAQFRVDPVPGAVLQYRLDGQGAWLPTDGVLNLWDLQDGPHSIAFRAYDAARELVSEEATRDFVLDTVDPKAPTKLAGPDETTTSSRTATFGFDGEADATYECLLDATIHYTIAGARTSGPEWVSCTSPWTVRDLTLGQHTLYVRQIDAAGNSSEPTSWTWSVVEPDPEPAAPAPQPQAPAADTPKPAAPAPAPAPAAKPVAAKLSVGVPAGKGRTPTATATGRRVAVGCASPGATDYRCTVTVTRGGKTVGGGRRTGAGVVPVDLDRATARKVQRLGGLKVRVTLTVKTADGGTKRTHETVRVLPKKVLVVPTDGLFAFDSATPSKQGRALAASLARQLDGARTITIVGHTDDVGSADVNRRLGQRRAEAFRRLLAAAGFDGDVAVRSAGDTEPRAKNATKDGRALNRRVEIEVRY